MKIKSVFLTLCILTLFQGNGLADNFWIAGNGNYWTNSANWSQGVVPDATTSVNVPGTNTNQYVGGDIIVDSPAFAKEIKLYAGTYAFHITNGVTLTLSGGGNAIFTTGSGIRTINIYTNSSLVDGALNLDANCVRASLNIYSGATVLGFDDFRSGSQVKIAGGSWIPAKLSAAGSIILNDATVLLESGTLYLGLHGNNSVRWFNLFDKAAPTPQVPNPPDTHPKLTLSGGNIVLVPQGGYVPKAGHSYTLVVNNNPTGGEFIIGSGTSVSIQGYPALSFDYSEWQTLGKLTVMNMATMIIVK